MIFILYEKCSSRLFKAKIKNVQEWKLILNAISGVMRDAMFIINNNGITIRGMDPSHIALLNVTFPKSSFEILKGGNLVFGLKIEDFKTIMKNVDKNDIVELEISEPSVMKIFIKGSFTLENSLNLIQKSYSNTPIPKTEYKTRISLDSIIFSQILSKIQRISEYVTINCNSDHVEFLGKGKTGNAKINLNRDDPEIKELSCLENSSAAYSIEYMSKIIRDIGRASKILNMEYSNDNSMRILFELPSTAKVEYYLAPRTKN